MTSGLASSVIACSTSIGVSRCNSSSPRKPTSVAHSLSATDPGVILNPWETVFLPSIGDALAVHLACESLAPVHVDLHLKGEPGLDSAAHESERRMHPVVIKK